VASAPTPPPAERGDIPVATPAAPPAADTPRPDTAQPEPPAAPAVASAPPPGPVAMVPPPAPDIRSAFRRGGGGGGIGAGGAGGTGLGRGGIVGEPISLESKDSELTDYLERIKRLIKQNWVYPCLKDQQTSVCEYKSTELIVEFGILKPGPVQYVEIRRASPYSIYDAYAVNAIKLASPFPPVPAALMARMGQGSTGASITARFVYVYETGLTNVLR
jgi:TonB family protein